jgi:hypothetical protein
MAWPDRRHHCNKPGVEVGHGLYLCLDCQDTALKDLIKLQKDRAKTDAELKRLAQQMAGQQPIRTPILPVRGQDLSSHIESNRRKH